MASYNKVILMGNLTRDPHVNGLPSGTAVCEFGLAVNRTWTDASGTKQEEVLFIDCTAFGRVAETLGQYLTKGDRSTSRDGSSWTGGNRRGSPPCTAARYAWSSSSSGSWTRSGVSPTGSRSRPSRSRPRKHRRTSRANAARPSAAPADERRPPPPWRSQSARQPAAAPMTFRSSPPLPDYPRPSRPRLGHSTTGRRGRGHSAPPSPVLDNSTLLRCSMSRKISTVQPDESAVLIPLAKLTPGRHNPRRVKPERDAHRRLVASIRAHGLLQPLIVRLDDAAPGSYRVTAGNRRLSALREVYKKDEETRVPCVVRADEDDDAARAVALAENFAREPMHPLDEATAFAKLAREDGQNAEQIAADFGVTPAYVRQRMKLAALSELVQIAYRTGTIDTATAEAFAAVPPERQDAIWAEVDGHPQHAHHVRNVIAHGWIDAQHALFERVHAAGLDDQPRPVRPARPDRAQRVRGGAIGSARSRAAAVDGRGLARSRRRRRLMLFEIGCGR